MITIDLGIVDIFSFKTYDLHHFFNNIMIPSCYYNSCNRVSLLRNLHIYLHYGQKWGLTSHDHHNLHNHHPLSSGQGWTGCGGATGGFSKNSARRKGFFFKNKFLLIQIQIFIACANFREQPKTQNHHNHSHQHHPDDVARYNRRDFAVELFTTVSEENIFPMVNLNGRQVMVLILLS